MKRLIFLAIMACSLGLGACALDTTEPYPEDTDTVAFEETNEQPERAPGLAPGPSQPYSTRSPDNGGPTPYPWTVQQQQDPNDPTPYPWQTKEKSGNSGSGSSESEPSGTSDSQKKPTPAN